MTDNAAYQISLSGDAMRLLDRFADQFADLVLELAAEFAGEERSFVDDSQQVAAVETCHVQRATSLVARALADARAAVRCR